MGRLIYTTDRGVEWVSRPAAETHAHEVSLHFTKAAQTKIGVVLHRSSGFLKVYHVQPGSLADGTLRVGDILLSVNGEVSRADQAIHMARLILAADDLKLKLLRRSSSEISEPKPIESVGGKIAVSETHASLVQAALAEDAVAKAEPDEVCEVEAFEIEADDPSAEANISPGSVLCSPDLRALAEANMALLTELRESDRTTTQPKSVAEQLVLDDFHDDDCFET